MRSRGQGMIEYGLIIALTEGTMKLRGWLLILLAVVVIGAVVTDIFFAPAIAGHFLILNNGWPVHGPYPTPVPTHS